MRFKVDENLPLEVAVHLRMAGHDAMTVLEQALRGHPDDDIALVCRCEQHAILTLDLDFSNMKRYPPQDAGRPQHHRSPGTALSGHLERSRADLPEHNLDGTRLFTHTLATLYRGYADVLLRQAAQAPEPQAQSKLHG